MPPRKQNSPVPPGMPIMQYLAGQMAAGALVRGEFPVQPKSAEQELIDRDAATTEELREKCRQGNPFPLVAWQWPFLVLTDPEEIDLFNRSMDRPEVFERLTDCIRSACLDLSNPPLRLDWWQKIIIAGFFDMSIGEIATKGATGTGKGASVGLAINLWYDVFGESRTTLTSETYAHALANIFGEVTQWRMKMTHPAPGSLLSESISESKRHYVIVRNPASDTGEAFSGAHGSNTLYVYDEATAVSDTLIDNSEKNARKIVMLANPRTLLGRFRAAFEPLGDRLDEIGICYGNIGQRICVTVSGLDTMNVVNGRLKLPVAPRGGITIRGTTYDQGRPIPQEEYELVKPLIPNQIDTALYRNNAARPDPREVAIYAHGRFPTEDPLKQVILVSWLARHQEYWRKAGGEIGEKIPVTCFGLDVARSLVGDRTVLAAGSDIGMRELLDARIPDVTMIADWVVSQAAERYGLTLTHGRVPVAIDYGGGYGSGVGDLLRRRGVWVIEFQPGSGSRFSPRNFANLRTESYALLGMRLDPQGPYAATPWALPPADGLVRELTAPEKMYGSDLVRFGLQPKELIKQKMAGHSPDLADATTYLFHAVRILHNLDEYFRSYERPPVIWPVVEPGSKLAERMGEERREEVEKFRDEMRREELRPEFAGLRLLDAPAGPAGGSGDGAAADGTTPAGTGDPKIDEFVRFAREMYGADAAGTAGGGGGLYAHLFDDD